MNKTSKIYIAGARGLVGQSLFNYLVKLGYNNIIKTTHQQLDLKNQVLVDEFFSTNKPLYVYLIAAKIGGISENLNNKVDYLYDSTMINCNVISAAFRNSVKKLIFISSNCVYPWHFDININLLLMLTTPIQKNNLAYTIAKIVGTKLCEYYKLQYDSNYIAIMPGNIYGPYDSFNLNNCHVASGMIRRFHLAKLFLNNKYSEIIKDIKI